MKDVGASSFADTYHQQDLVKNPTDICGLAGTGVACPIDVVSLST